MKICPKCKKPGEFHKNRKRPGGLQGWCKKCNRKNTRQHYRANPALYRQRLEAIRQRKVRLVFDYLVEHPCVDCGEKDPVVLDFDHVRGQKLAGICLLLQRNASFERLEAEIKKCVVRCSNCHRRKTAKEGGYRRLFLKRESEIRLNSH